MRFVLDFINKCLFGIRGTVTDTIGNPLNAMIWVINHDEINDSSMVFTDPDIGNYHRLIEPGTYDLVASANGYLNDTIKNIVVSSESVIYASFVLDTGQNPITNIKEIYVEIHKYLLISY